MTERMNTIPPKDNNILVAVEWGNYSYWWQWSGGTIHIGGSGVGKLFVLVAVEWELFILVAVEWELFILVAVEWETIHIGGSGVGELFILREKIVLVVVEIVFSL